MFLGQKSSCASVPTPGQILRAKGHHQAQGGPISGPIYFFFARGQKHGEQLRTIGFKSIRAECAILTNDQAFLPLVQGTESVKKESDARALETVEKQSVYLGSDVIEPLTLLPDKVSQYLVAPIHIS